MSKNQNKSGVSPANATHAELCRICRNNYETKTHWILSDGYSVSLAEQKTGEPAQQSISIPRKTFNRLLRWYLKEQKFVRK